VWTAEHVAQEPHGRCGTGSEEFDRNAIPWLSQYFDAFEAFENQAQYFYHMRSSLFDSGNT